METARSTAECIASCLAQHGVTRVYGLCGGHIQPLWDALGLAGIDIVDVRHEASAVYMAHAEAELSGRLGVALVTAGPGLANAVTAIANASAARTPVLIISARAPRPQAGLGAMQDIPQAQIVAPLCVHAAEINHNRNLCARLGTAVHAANGGNGPTGPAYLDFPTDLLDEPMSSGEGRGASRHRAAHSHAPSAADVESARALIADSQRPIVIAGRTAHTAPDALRVFLEQSGALYLDTAESRGAVPRVHPCSVSAMRSRAFQETDLVITLGQQLDFRFAYGSPAVFSPTASFLRIGRSTDEISDNRTADVGILADTASALDALTTADATPEHPDVGWRNGMREANNHRRKRLADTMANPPDTTDGRIHPYHLLAALDAQLDEDSVAVADGGDILSFARVSLQEGRYLDCGALGCLGVGVPFATAAAINRPDRPVIAVVGDGSFGFTAIEIDTAVRQNANILVAIANNQAWNIERNDQIERYQGRLIGVDLPNCRYDLVARGLGAYAERVDDLQDLSGAIQRGMQNTPAVLDVLTTRDAVSPDFTSGLAAVPTLHAVSPWHDEELKRSV